MNVLFMVNTAEQAADAAAVMAHLPDWIEVTCFDAYRAEIVDMNRQIVARPFNTSFDLVQVTRAVTRVGQLFRTRAPQVVVYGQDLGFVERAVIAVARRRGITRVLMPDGIVTTTPVGARGRGHDAALVIDRVLQRIGVFAGTRDHLGASIVPVETRLGDHHAQSTHLWNPAIRQFCSPQPAIL